MPSGIEVPYELRTSSIAGKGIFATAPIARGTRIWRYEIGVSVVTYTNESEVRKRLDGLSKEEAVDFLEHVYTYGGVVIEILDDAKVYNHAADHNTGNHPDDEAGEMYAPDHTYARRDIAAGEELTDDYATYETIDWYESICKEYAAISCVNVGHTYREDNMPPTALPAAPAEPEFDMKALKEQEAAELKKKIEENAKKAKEKEKEEDARIARMQELEASGIKVAGGMHKFDASEVDVHGGNATADDFLDAFGM